MVILEKETFEKFGYYSSDLSPQSHKKILAACDDCGGIREITKQGYHALCKSCVQKGNLKHYGKHHSIKTREIMSINNRGENNPNYGKPCSTETKKKISDANRGRRFSIESRQKMSAAQKGRHHTKETRKKMSLAQLGEKHPNWKGGKMKRICKNCGKVFHTAPSNIKYGGGKYCSLSCTSKATRRYKKIPTHHTKPERIFESICKKNDLPFKYAGDGSFWIHNINPDFIESNGKKLVVEIFGDYWHSPLLNYKLREDKTLSYRKRILKKNGYKLIVLWETDLKRKDAEAFVLHELNKHKVL